MYIKYHGFKCECDIALTGKPEALRFLKRNWSAFGNALTVIRKVIIIGLYSDMGKQNKKTTPSGAVVDSFCQKYYTTAQERGQAA